ncbi:hypothetical protein BDF14DRAFT_1790410 [Spinellus fusiger]|nr:hypothetical protein BDF14DRAFT_1790410 [Spinellus fusiger]
MQQILLSVFSQIRIIVVVFILTAILYTRSLHTLYFTCGTFVTAATAKVLKNVLRHPRPTHTLAQRKKSYGMPSSHSQSIAYCAVYVHFGFIDAYISNTVTLCALVSMCYGIALTVFWSRISLKHHTLSQVLVGAIVGAFMGFGWLLLWHNKIVYYESILEPLIESKLESILMTYWP